MSPRCVAPVGDGEDLCGAPATEERAIEGLVVPLCESHARDLDSCGENDTERENDNEQ